LRPIVVFTNGCFDGLHEGHINLLREAKELGEYLVVGLNSDLSVKYIKGEGRPYFNQKSRMAVLNAIKYIDRVIVFCDHTPERLIKKIKPNILVKGGDWIGKEVAGREYVESTGGKVVFIPREVEISQLKHKIKINQ
jgi:D-beta-D-heptose 7-phosphate kinase/D-beta-D-heptose 1-phosphate adenosyltransferase